GKNAAMAERAGAKLHTAAIPGDHAAVRDQAGGFGAGFFERSIVDGFDIAGFLNRRVDRMRWAQEGYRHAGIADFTSQRRAIESCTECGSIVACGRLDVDFVKEPASHQAAVGSAVQGDSAGKR